ncbi:sensor histidine kinase [Brevibacillus daliensis]|uniref:sensor histidine kinase n=1 Tax=Brevibacillus daliensis TaxID=2892995 RepID=UPI001E3696E3|nr:HAMP domain-containing sensor histidine kinase [Brevibacillus daliensis]
MTEEKIIKNQQRKLMIYNFIAFTIIFTIFGLIIFSQTKLTLYSKTDRDLLAFKSNIERVGLIGLQKNKPAPPGIMPPPEFRLEPNPRIIILLWDKNKELLNPESTAFYGDFFEDLHYKPYESITNITLSGMYTYRTITFPNPDTEDTAETIQLMVNVDGEQNVINNYQTLLILCSIVFLFLSLTASFILSRKTMKPIIQAWDKQREFVENASHELRTPLTIIQNKLELLLTTPYAKIMDKFDAIALTLSETRRLSKLTSDLLTLARADSIETQLEKESFYLDQFIQTICQPYYEIAEVEEKDFRVDVEGNTMIVADKNRMHQLLVILLDNALKYTGNQDTIVIKMGADEHKITLEVCDTGIGISDEGLENIFSRFYRDDKARSREKGGTGLGLAIAEWIVTSHKGTIQASHNTPSGTCITITLPK